MKCARLFILLAIMAWLLPSCEKNNVSKIPSISYVGMSPENLFRVGSDSIYIEFSLMDGDGDIGYGTRGAGDSVSKIYFRDMRFDTAPYVPYEFPTINTTVENPKYGIQGTCIFRVLQSPAPRNDSMHNSKGDTVVYQIYIRDRAGDSSNHIFTPPLRVQY